MWPSVWPSVGTRSLHTARCTFCDPKGKVGAARCNLKGHSERQRERRCSVFMNKRWLIEMINWLNVPGWLRLQPRAVILKPQQGSWLPDSLCSAPRRAVPGSDSLTRIEKRRLITPRPRPPLWLDFLRSDLQSDFRSALGYRGHSRSDRAVLH